MFETILLFAIFGLLTFLCIVAQCINSNLLSLLEQNKRREEEAKKRHL